MHAHAVVSERSAHPKIPFYFTKKKYKTNFIGLVPEGKAVVR